MINGAFMEDLSELLNSATGDQRRRLSFYEIDTEFEDGVSAKELHQYAIFDALPPRESTSVNDAQARFGGQGQGRVEES